ncbi:GreA/GreB family elongation factor [Clostridium fallax]|uniref:Transcription elongation factor, GreA/GreB family n=1 Tax=Clostridium fallax TaxID=1533 RepID=A0A1M4Z8M2_9CLOT|nr:GreA/GreB family elongation factor [Clostridium fallax]SHF14364.1 Transcription elongation factor, GreA/GreB family [Clostridium fallax]SQB07486.1 transcription elongation factor GreA [Clostridium fallax]
MKCVGILLCNYYDDSSETKILLENKRKNIMENLESRCRSCFEDKNREKRKKQKETHINNRKNKRKNRNYPLLNKIITLKCIKFESILEVKIVKKNESNQFQNLFSEKSNFGKAFLNKSIVDKVRLVLGNGYMEYIILKI